MSAEEIIAGLPMVSDETTMIVFFAVMVVISIIAGLFGGWVDNNDFGKDFWKEAISVAAATMFAAIFWMIGWYCWIAK